MSFPDIVNLELNELNANSVLIINRLLATLFIFVLAVLAKSFVRKLIHRLISTKLKNKTRRIQTIEKIFSDMSSIVIWSMAIIIILAKWNFNIAPIITGAGILGLAVGFGSQMLVRDFVTGLFILLENQFNVDDKVQIADVTGVVREINIRTTEIIDDENNIYIIPNSQIAKVKLISDDSDKT